MDEKQKKEILNRFDALPKDIQQLILSSGFPQKISGVSEKHLLSKEQEDTLSNETMFVMIGLEHPNDFVENIRRELKITPEKAAAVAVEVNEKVFKEIRAALMALHEERRPPSAERMINHAPLMPPVTPPFVKQSAPPLAPKPMTPAISQFSPAPLRRPTPPIFPPAIAPVSQSKPPQGTVGVRPTAVPPPNLPTGETELKKPTTPPPPPPPPLKPGVGPTELSTPTLPPPMPEAQSESDLLWERRKRAATGTPVISQVPATPEKRYNADPYREPVE